MKRTLDRTSLKIVALTLLLALLAACDDAPPAAAPDGGAALDGPAAGADTGAVKDDDAAGGPWANVFLQNPITDQKKTTRVALKHLTSSKGNLTGKHADVWNCLPEAGGQTFQMMGISGKLCHLQQKALPDKNGSYLQILPPKSYVAGDDAFAEVMMYHHITTIHDHYTGSFGLKHLDKQSLYAIVNLQGLLSIGNSWTGFPNAAFMPKENAGYLKQLGIDLLKGRDAIVFGLSNGGLLGAGAPQVNFSYDASVIYHEYTHYAIGSGALNSSATPDKYGLNPTPIGLNEGLADYLPASYLDNATLGAYALGSQSRDLSRDLRCPAHLVGESHNDGEIASGALWAARKLLGAKVLDRAVWDAVLTFGADTTFDEAATAVLDEVKKSAPDKYEAAAKIFKARGFSSCVRLADHKDFSVNPQASLAGVAYPGGYQVSTKFKDGYPAYLQHRIVVAAGTKELTINYQAQQSSSGGGTATSDVWVALKRGDQPIAYTYASGDATHDADAVLKGTGAAGAARTLVLSGDCVAQGELVFHFLNRGNNPGRVTSATVTQSATVTNVKDNFSGCGR